MENNKLIAEFMGAEIEIWKAHERLGDDTSKDAWYAYFDGNGVAVEELAYHTSWDWLMPVVNQIRVPYNYTEITGEKYEDIISVLAEGCVEANQLQVYEAVVEFIKEYNTEQLHEWARINLLPQENAETRLRFAEGIEDYDEDYIKEMYNATNK